MRTDVRGGHGCFLDLVLVEIRDGTRFQVNLAVVGIR